MPTDAQPTPRPTRSGLKVLAVGLGVILLLALYVGSMRPAHQWMRGIQDRQSRIEAGNMLDTIYAPVWWVARTLGMHRTYLWLTGSPVSGDWESYPPLPNP